MLIEHFKKTDKDGVPCKLTFFCRHYDRKVQADMEAEEAALAASKAPAPDGNC